jgi:putative Ca2+/H+ antiporter (TMEM165/GDT1 family)
VNLAVAAAVFPVIFLGELPDKTMFASLVLATKGRPRAVWLGSTGAFAVHVIIATTIGVMLFRVLPHRAVETVVALTFLAGAVFAIREAARGAGTRTGQGTASGPIGRRRRTIATAFLVIFVAEWGDLTQILTVNLAARYHSPLSVGIGALVALAAVAGIAVLSGQGMLRFVNITAVRVITAILLVGLAAYTGWTALS